MVLHTVFVLFICWVMNESIQPNTVLMPFWIACKGATMSAPMTPPATPSGAKAPLKISPIAVGNMSMLTRMTTRHAAT